MRGFQDALRLSVLVVIFCARPLAAAAFLPIDLDEVFRRAHQVFVGKVRNVECRWDAERKMIWTHVTFDVLEVWSGEKTGQKTLRVAGGTVDGKTIVVTHVPRFDVAETYVVAAQDPREEYASPVVGTEQGYFREVTEEASGRTILVDGDRRCLERGPNGALFRGRLTSPAAAPSFVRFVPADAGAGTPEGGEAPKIEPPVYRDADGNVVKTGRSRMRPTVTRAFMLRGEPVGSEQLREFARSAREPRPER